jgi:hypothetical protein
VAGSGGPTAALTAAARALWIAAAIIAVGGAPHAPQDVAPYRRMVDDYRARILTTDQAAAQLQDADLPALVERLTDSTDALTPIERRAAAVLHTDVCLYLLKSERHAHAAAHLDVATALLDSAVPTAPADVEFARRWHAIVGGLLHARGAVSLASDLRARAATRFIETTARSQARAAFERGLMAEIQAATAGPISGSPRNRSDLVPRDAVSGLRSAAREFETALSLDRELIEAALHLGRIRTLEGSDVEATRWLDRAAAGGLASERYLARLFLGAIAERQGRHSDAEAEYRSALDGFRWGQAAAFALSHLLGRLGRDAEARATLLDHFARTRGHVVEPLWTYVTDPYAHLGQSLETLRAEVWR